MCVCFITFVTPLGRGGTQALSCGCKVDQVDFTDMMSFLASNLMVDISPNSEVLVQIPESFYQDGIAKKTKMI